jgi:SpoVK/Ycf46/Vps4 family AAA+-type ATPase
MSFAQWRQDNAGYTDMLATRLRLLLRRRTLWLRHVWQGDELHLYRNRLVSDAQAERLLTVDDGDDAEQRFYGEDKTSAELAMALQALETQRSALAQRMREGGRPPALEVLAEAFGLTPFETDVLTLTAAPAWDAGFERLFAYLQDDAARTHPTLELARTIFPSAASRLSCREALHATRPLRRFRLIEVLQEPGAVGSPLLSPLRIDPRVLDFLDGVNRGDDRVRPLLRSVQPIPISLDQQAQAALLADQLTRADATWPVVNLVGSTEGGADGVARAACEQIGARLAAVDLRRLSARSPEDREQLYAVLEREAWLANWVYLLDLSSDTTCNDPATQRVATELAERLCAMIVLVSHERWSTDATTAVIPTPKPSRGAQCELWRAIMADVPHSLNGTVEEVAEQFDFGPRAIIRAVVGAQERARRRAHSESGAVSARDVWDACREVSSIALDDLAVRIEPCFSWTDIVLPGETLLQLRELADQVRRRAVVYETWGFGAQLGRGRGVNALFAGVSGTGKTMAADILARELNLDLHRIDLSGVVSKYIGETEKNLRRIFDAGGGTILFFDEADALFGARSEVRDSHDRYANIEVNYLLQRMEDHTGIAILATNRKASLDAAFLRRLRFVIDFPFPDADSRRRIWRQVFPPKAAVDELDLDLLSRWEIAGGNIRNIALNAAFLAAADAKPIGMKHIVRAAVREYRKIDRVISVAEFGAYATQGRA